MSHFCCLCPVGASHRPARTQGGEIDCTTTWRGCGYHVEGPATCGCGGNFPGDGKTSHCHSTGNPEDKGSGPGWGEGQCPAQDVSDSVRAQLRPGVVGESMREERQEPGRRQPCRREPRMVSARSTSRSHWLHCHWGRLYLQAAHPSDRDPGSRKQGLGPLEKLNCPELQEPQVPPSWAQPGSPASQQFPRGDVPAASGAQGSHPPVTRPSRQALS